MRTFAFEGAEYPYVANPNDITFDESEVVEAAYGGDLIDMLRSNKSRLLRVLGWATVHRGRCGCTPLEPRPDGCQFTIIDAGRITFAAHPKPEPKPEPAAPAPSAAEVAMLSPTSAGPSRPRKRAAASKPGSAAATPPGSRRSTASGRGKSGA